MLRNCLLIAHNLTGAMMLFNPWLRLLLYVNTVHVEWKARRRAEHRHGSIAVRYHDTAVGDLFNLIALRH